MSEAVRIFALGFDGERVPVRMVGRHLECVAGRVGEGAPIVIGLPRGDRAEAARSVATQLRHWGYWRVQTVSRRQVEVKHELEAE